MTYVTDAQIARALKDNGKAFVSEGKHNRQCPVCFAANSECAA